MFTGTGSWLNITHLLSSTEGGVMWQYTLNSFIFTTCRKHRYVRMYMHSYMIWGISCRSFLLIPWRDRVIQNLISVTIPHMALRAANRPWLNWLQACCILFNLPLGAPMPTIEAPQKVTLCSRLVFARAQTKAGKRMPYVFRQGDLLQIGPTAGLRFRVYGLEVPVGVCRE